MKELLERFRSWWSGLAPRERALVATGAAVLGVTVLYLAVWEPVFKAAAQREAQLGEARALAQRLEEIAHEAGRARSSGSSAAQTGRNLSLLSAVDQAAKSGTLGKPLSRIQPEGDKQVRIWLDDVPFDALGRWISDLQLRYGVQVEAADLERESGPGLVNARLTLVRP